MFGACISARSTDQPTVGQSDCRESYLKGGLGTAQGVGVESGDEFVEFDFFFSQLQLEIINCVTKDAKAITFSLKDVIASSSESPPIK